MKDYKAQIARLIEDAQRDDAADKRADLFDRYMSEPYGDEAKGRSSFISSDVSDVVEAILPDLMDVFTSAEDIVAFDPVGPEDEEAAEQETQAVSHMFWQQNEGFTNLYIWIKEALIQQNSYIKRGWEEKQRVTVEEYEDLTMEELVGVLDGIDAEYEFLEQSENEDGTINVKIRCVKKSKRYVIQCIPQEEFFHTPRWNKVSLEGIPCCGHRQDLTRGELIAMGFDEKSVDDAAGTKDSTQTDDRFDTEDNYESQAEQGDDATRKVRVYEAYMWLDINDDGIAEQVKVWAAGDGSKVLKWKNGKDAIDEKSGVPFSALTPYIVPHRHVGRSVAELVDDIQKVKTALLRITLDNTYATNYARPYFDEGMASHNTYTDLMNPAPGAPVRTGGAEVQWFSPQPVIGNTLPLIEGFDALKEMRTGATRYNQGLDAESLNKTATGIQRIMDASQKKTLLIARVIAETGLRDLFLGIHRDLRSGPIKELVMKLTGKWIAVNPREWADRSDMTVKVGMGSGDRDQKRAGLTLMGQIQEKLMMAGSRTVDESHIYAAAEEMMSTFGFMGIDKFMTRPDQLPPAPPAPPPPELLLAQKQMEIMENESKSRIALDAQKAQWEHERKSHELGIKASAEEAKSHKMASDIMDADEDRAFQREEMHVRAQLEREKMEVQEEIAGKRSQ